MSAERESRERPSRERVESLLEELPESGWTIPEPPALREPPASPDRPTVGAPESAPAREQRNRFGGLGDLLRRPIPLAATIGACLLLASAGLAGGLLLSSGEPTSSRTVTIDRPAERVLSSSELRAVGGAEASGSARVLEDSDGSRRVELSVSGVPPTGPGRYLEAWLMRGKQFVSLGSFEVTGSGRRTVEVPLPVDPAAYRVFDVSLERADGDPTHGTDSLLRGPV